MTDTLSLEHLYDGVVARFAVIGMGAVKQPFGWREVAQQQVDDLRICWVPGDANGALGTVGPAMQPGRDPRPLATLMERFHVVISGRDPSAPEDERLQYKATRLLYNAWYAAMYRVARGTFTSDDGQWVTTAGVNGSTPRHERRNGTALVVNCTLQALLPEADFDAGLSVDGVRAVIDAEMGADTVETFETAPEPIMAAAATTQNITLSGEQTIDDEFLLSGAVALVKDQDNGVDNGLWIVDDGVWTRAGVALESGMFVGIMPGGTVNGDHGFVLSTPDPIVVGVTPLTWTLLGPFS